MDKKPPNTRTLDPDSEEAKRFQAINAANLAAKSNQPPMQVTREDQERKRPEKPKRAGKE